MRFGGTIGFKPTSRAVWRVSSPSQARFVKTNLNLNLLTSMFRNSSRPTCASPTFPGESFSATGVVGPRRRTPEPSPRVVLRLRSTVRPDGARTRFYERRIQRQNRKIGVDKFFVYKRFLYFRQTVAFAPESKAAINCVPNPSDKASRAIRIRSRQSEVLRSKALSCRRACFHERSATAARFWGIVKSSRRSAALLQRVGREAGSVDAS